MSRLAIWTPKNIDGFACAAMFRYMDGDILHFYETPDAFEAKFIEWLDSKGHMYDKIYICSFELNQKFINTIDRDNIKVLIKKTSTNIDIRSGKLYKYENLSCAKHLYDIFKGRLGQDFVDLADLCNNISVGEVGVREFKHLLYFNGISDPLKNKSIRALYKNGLREFSTEEKDTLDRFKSETQREIRNISTFTGGILGNNTRAIISDSLSIDTYTLLAPNDDYNLNIFIYPSLNKVVLKTCGMHLSEFRYVVDRYFRGEVLGLKGYGEISPQLEELLDKFVELP